MQKLKICVLFLAALCLAESAVAQNVLDKLVFKNGTEQSIDIWRNTEDVVYGFYPGDTNLQKVDKSLLSKIVYRDGKEEIVSVSVKTTEKKTKKQSDEEGMVFHPGNVQIGVGAGVPFDGLGSYKIPPLWASLNVGVAQWGQGVFVLGAMADYYQRTLGTDVGNGFQFSRFSVEALAGYHFFISRAVDMHARFGAGYWQSDLTNHSNGLSTTALAGFSFYLGRNLAISAEGGYHNGGTARLGIILNI